MNDNGLLYCDEKTFQTKILKWLDKNELYNVKQNASGISKVGVPDIIMNIRGLFVAIEVKREEGIVSELQKYSINVINKLEGISIVLRPSMFNEFKRIINWLLDKNKINNKDINQFKIWLRNISIM